MTSKLPKSRFLFGDFDEAKLVDKSASLWYYIMVICPISSDGRALDF